MLKKLLVAAMVLVSCVLFGSVCLAAPGVGSIAPQIMVNNEEGQTVGLLTFEKVTVLNFWATWCPPCRNEMPELNKFYAMNSDQVCFYAVTKESKDTVYNFMRKNNYELPLLFDINGQVGQMYGITAIPTTFIIDTNGVIRHRILGGTTANTLMELIAQLQ